MKIEQKHFDYFVERCQHWQRELGLTNYRIFYSFKELDEDTYAQVESTELEQQMAHIILNTEHNEITSDKELDLNALHEMTHVLLRRLSACASYRHTTESEIKEAEHEIIRRLENYLFKN